MPYLQQPWLFKNRGHEEKQKKNSCEENKLEKDKNKKVVDPEKSGTGQKMQRGFVINTQDSLFQLALGHPK